MSSIGKLDKI